MYATLIKAQLSQQIASLVPRKNDKRVGVARAFGTALVLLYVAAAISLVVGFLLNYLAKALLNGKYAYTYYVIVGTLYIMIGLFGSLFSAKNFMFDSKDNELLLSMPITARAILACRVAVLFVMNFIYSLLVSGPCLFICSRYRSIDGSFIIKYTVAWILLVFVSITFSCLFGMIVGYISSKMRRKRLGAFIVTVLLIVGIYFLGGNFKNYGMWLISNASGLSDILKRLIPPVYWFGMSCNYGGITMFISQALWCLLPFSAVYLALSSVYFKILTTNKGLKKSVYKGRLAFYGNSWLALVKKELKRFFTVTVYLMNSALGIIMQITLIAVLAIDSKGILKMLLSIGIIKNIFPVLAVYLLCFTAASTCTTACSLSMEGEDFWVIKSMPVGGGKVICAKIAANMAVALPTLLAVQIMLCKSYSFRRNETIYLFVIPILAQLCTAMLGMFFNLLFPKLTWSNPTMPVKQSLSVMLSLSCGFILTVIPMLVYFFGFKAKFNTGVFLAFTMVYFAVLCTALAMLLASVGRMRYNRINC